MASAAQSAGQIRDLEGELRSRYGQGPRGGVNIRAAAADLGVKPSTVKAWIRNARAGRPVPERSDAVNQLRRQAGEDRMRQRGATMRLTGTIRISADARRRNIEYAFTGDEMAHYLDLRDAGDPQALEDWLADVYIGGDTLVDDLEFLEFDPIP